MEVKPMFRPKYFILLFVVVGAIVLMVVAFSSLVNSGPTAQALMAERTEMAESATSPHAPGVTAEVSADFGEIVPVTMPPYTVYLPQSGQCSVVGAMFNAESVIAQVRLPDQSVRLLNYPRTGEPVTQSFYEGRDLQRKFSDGTGDSIYIDQDAVKGILDNEEVTYHPCQDLAA